MKLVMRSQATLEYIVVMSIFFFLYLVIIYPAYMYAFRRFFMTVNMIVIKQDLQEVLFFDALRTELGKFNYTVPPITLPNSSFPQTLRFVCYHIDKYCCKLEVQAIYYDPFLNHTLTAIAYYPEIVCYNESLQRIVNTVCSKIRYARIFKVFGDTRRIGAVSICNISKVEIINKW
jgi:hypothetical protein